MNETEFGLNCSNTVLPWQVIREGTVESTAKFTILSHISLFYSENIVFPTVLGKICWHLESKQMNIGAIMASSQQKRLYLAEVSSPWERLVG